MAVRTSMTDLIAKIRQLIGDPASVSQQFDDQTIQDTLDQSRIDVRYESLLIGPSLVNNANTDSQADTIFADFYSHYGYFESDVTLQGYQNGKAWIVVSPVAMELMLDQAHFQFETDVFNTGTPPGQLPPIFLVGKSFDPFNSAADLLEMWAATLTCAYDFSVDGRSFHRSQMLQAKLTLAQQYRKRARPKVSKMVRSDIRPSMDTVNVRLLDSADLAR
jgi:hypothetical protein